MAVDHNNPQSRDEEILIATIDGKEYDKAPQSRIEELLLELKETIEEGGGGGGIRPIGVTTTPLYDGATTNPIQINGESYTAETGDMVTYQSTEFMFNVNEVWQELGDVSVVLAIIDDIFADIAPAFDATSTYAVGDYVIYNDQFYKCTTAHTGAWDANDFTATTISDEIADVADALDDIKDGTDIDSFGDVETALAGKQGTILHGALDASGGVDGDLYLKTASSSNMDVCGTPTANTGDGYEISTNVSVYSNYEAYKAFGDGDGFGKNGMGDATLVYHVTSGKKFKPSVISLCNNFDVSGGFLTAKGYAYASTDGVNWDTLFSFFDLSTKNESISFDITTNKFYSYFKFQFGGSGGYPGIKNIVILGESDSEDDNRVDNVFYKQDGKWLKDAFAKKADVDSALAEKQDTLTFDNAPTENSNNPVKSGGIFTALAGKVNAENGKGLSTNDYSDTEKTQVATNASDIGQLKSGLTTLDTEVNGDATVYQYADVITIEDAVPSNLADCSVKIEPVQDLHGYDKPWVGGAGKNKLPLVLADIKALNTDGTWSGNAYTLNDVTFTVNEDNDGNVTGIKVNGTATANTYFYIDSPLSLDDGTAYYFNGCPTGGSSSTFRLQVYVNSNYYSDSGNGNNFTYVSGSSYARISVISGTELSNIDFYPMICLNSETDKTYAPYSNLCPISGYTEASVQRGGKNLFDESAITTGKGITEDSSLADSGISCVSDYIRVMPNTTYYLTAHNDDGNRRVGFYDQYKNNLQASTAAKGSRAFTTPANCAYCRVSVATSYVGETQLELGSTATPYVPYAGNTYTIALGDTIYGGTVDFDSGVMTVDRAMLTLDGTEQGWSTDVTSGGKRRFSNAQLPSFGYTSTAKISALSNIFENTTSSDYDLMDDVFILRYINGANRIDIMTEQFADTTELTTFLGTTNMQVLYMLATPTTVQLTPQQIQLLKGQNTLIASTGQISVTVNGVSGSIGQVQEQVNDHEERIEDVKSGLIGVSDRSRSNITTKLADLPTAVSEQNLEKYGYKIGDYFVGASGYTYILADMDTYYGGYNNNAIVNTHHISLVVKTGATSKWAETNDTSGGYKTSTLHSYLSSTVLDNIKSDMIALFGGSTGLEHLVSHKLLWTTATSAWEWSDNAEYISALSEPQVYGTKVWAIDEYQTGEAWKWLEVFHKFNFCEILGNIWWWLRSISSDSLACYASSYGFAYYRSASDSIGAVGLIIFH